MQTFLNEFLITTTNFLNGFVSDVDERFYEFESKLSKIEGSLLIIEAKVRESICWKKINHVRLFCCS